MAEAVAQAEPQNQAEFPFDTVARVFRHDADNTPAEGNTVVQDATILDPQTEAKLRQLPDLPSALKQPIHDRPERPEPQGRRSVQFARLPELDQLDGAVEGGKDERNDQTKATAEGRGSRTGALLSKLKIKTNAPRGMHTRSPSDLTVGASSVSDKWDAIASSGSEAQTPSGINDDYETENEADEEDSDEDERPDRFKPVPRQKKKSRRPQNDIQSAPSTPKSPSHLSSNRPSFFTSLSNQTSESPRPRFLRRVTTTDMDREVRQGVSEDEGRSRLAPKSPSAWSRGKRYLPHRSSANQLRNGEESNRPGAFKRAISGMGTSARDGGDVPPSPWRMRRDQTVSAGAARWRQIKAGLRAIGRTKKIENPMDTVKSAELLNELTAGAPAALMLASVFQRDESGARKIPILLEQLKVKLTNSQAIVGKSGDRHLTFKIDLEYGSGLTRMNWTIERTLRDFYFLHLKYYKYRNPVKTRRYVQPEGDDARAKLPRFPSTVLPYLRGARGLDVEDAEIIAELDAERAGQASADEGAPRRPPRRSRTSMSGILRRQSSLTGDEAATDGAGGNPAALAQQRRETWPERSRRKLDDYLQQLIRYLTYRPGTNRLCKFLELSALGVRLAAEGTYHGKEGRMAIVSGKGIDFRRALKPGLFKDRHTPKWFLVRHSYIVCTDSPQSVDVYDVFLVDSDFKLEAKEKLRSTTELESAVVGPDGQPKRRATGRHHLTLHNSERKVKLAAKNARQLAHFAQSIRTMAHNTPWSKKNRFNSFAPVRQNVFAQWLVDGRDYMWNVSRAISMAKDVIYIHDWWLSPELYMRRPAAIASKWRLDRLLKRKAEEGVKIFVIMYRNVESAIPIDSGHSKFTLLDLHPNVFVQRSPNQLRQGTFFWAHHEKICIIDHIIAFVGGIDLCFGRWDTPQHLLADDKPTGFEDIDGPKNADTCQLWPGKDYSNPRVQDFYGLDKPYEEMYDRSRVPRMPWHDIHMQVVGQPARDLTRHFVQRWNFVLRSRVPSRPTPFLLPPPDFKPGELEALGLEGTCEVQILRSCTEWSIGTPEKTEHSIMDAYCTIIKQSEHFIYIENQFFITSTECMGVKIENSIGDALVERIIRAYTNREAWKAVIIIPLIPGFQNTVDAQDGTSVRLIMQCQYRSISRGEESIFARLRKAGIEPEDYIQFFSLRTWGKIGPTQALVTEQLYIHAKCIIVDDRVAIIASANINERSQLGDRDSECGAVVRDTDSMWSTMAGKPYLVGRFPHTLRMRLMREHLGLDVDALEPHSHNIGDELDDLPDGTSKKSFEKPEPKRSIQSEAEPPTRSLPTKFDGQARGVRVTGNTGLEIPSDEETEALRPISQAGSTHTRRSRGTTVNREPSEEGEIAQLPPPRYARMNTYELGLPQLSTLPALPASDDTDIGGPGIHKMLTPGTAARVTPMLATMKLPEVTEDCMKDPLNEDFYHEIWNTVAENNTALYRAVFRCQPDSEVESWKQYHEYMSYAERFSQAQGAGKSVERTAQETASRTTGPPGAGSTNEKLAMMGKTGKAGQRAGEVVDKLVDKKHKRAEDSLDEKEHLHEQILTGAIERHESFRDGRKQSNEKHDGELSEKTSTPTENARTSTQQSDATLGPEPNEKTTSPAYVDRTSIEAKESGDPEKLGHDQASAGANGSKIQLQLPTETNLSHSGSRRTRRSTRSRKRAPSGMNDVVMPKEDAEHLLKLVQGHLIAWPYEWLAAAERDGNWLYHIDQLAPLEIYD